MSSVRNFDSLVDEVMVLSPFSPKVTSWIAEKVKAHYRASVLFATVDYPLVADTLYSKDDNVMYAIVSVSYVDDYYFYLLPADAVKVNKSVLREITFYVKDHEASTNKEIGEVIGKSNTLLSALGELMVSSTRSRRKAIVGDEPEFVLPSVEVMQAYYECGRKVQFSSEEDALEHLEGENAVYRCKRCNLWHQGRHPTGQKVAQSVMEGRWRTVWRREHGV